MRPDHRVFLPWPGDPRAIVTARGAPLAGADLRLHGAQCGQRAGLLPDPVPAGHRARHESRDLRRSLRISEAYQSPPSTGHGPVILSGIALTMSRMAARHVFSGRSIRSLPESLWPSGRVSRSRPTRRFVILSYCLLRPLPFGGSKMLSLCVTAEPWRATPSFSEAACLGRANIAFK